MSSNNLPIALLAIYSLLSLPTIFIIFKHGIRHGAILGWFYLFAFCTLRIISSALQLGDPTDSTAALVANIGLSPLLLSTCGILHESRAYLFPKRRRVLEIAGIVVFHQLVAAAIALVAAGASNLSDITENHNSQPDAISKNQTLVKVGEVLLLLAWLAVTVLAGFTAARVYNGRSKAGDFLIGGRTLVCAVALAMPFLGIRLLTSLVYFFTDDPVLNPVTGSVGLKVGLEIIEELVVSLVYIVAGLKTRNIGRVVQHEAL
ncbi:hypothetical protein HD806DRAFT_447913 [Xylariaceae sp. AK1471]|nr:hypothetical protein HD806DRAFT_447913 [Xylariaceae sp. AK1471]